MSVCSGREFCNIVPPVSSVESKSSRRKGKLYFLLLKKKQTKKLLINFFFSLNFIISREQRLFNKTNILKTVKLFSCFFVVVRF